MYRLYIVCIYTIYTYWPSFGDREMVSVMKEKGFASVAQALHDGGSLEADSQPLPRQFVSEVTIKMLEDELTDAKSLSSFATQSEDTMQDYIQFLVEPIEDWPRQRAVLDYFASKMDFLQKPEVTPERTANGLRGEGGVVTPFLQTLSRGRGRVASSHHSSKGCQEECCDDTPCS